MLKYLVLLIFLSSNFVIHAQSDFAVGMNGAVNFPTGQFAYFNTGYGGNAHFLYLLGNSTILTFSVGYNLFDLDVDKFNDRAKELGLNANFDVESDFKTIPFLIGAKWYFLSQKKHSLYIMLEAGLYNYQFTFNGTAYREDVAGNSIPIELQERDETGTETMLKISAGYLFFFSKHWFLDVSGGYIVLTDAFAINEPVNPEDPDAIYGVVGTLNYITAQAGINYRF
jgi:hypothetical protein